MRVHPLNRKSIDHGLISPLHISIKDLRQTKKKVYVEFKLTENEVTLTEPQISTLTRSVFHVLMSHETTCHPLNLIPRHKTRDNTTLLLATPILKSLVFLQPCCLIMKNLLPIFVLFSGTSTAIIIN